MLGVFDTTRVSRALLLILDEASGHRVTMAAAALLLLVALSLLAALLQADALATAMLKRRVARLPSPIRERLLEEWLAETLGSTRTRKLTFSLGLFLIPTSRLERAFVGDDDELPAGWTRLSLPNVKVSADLWPRVFAHLIDAAITIGLAMVLSALVNLPFPLVALDSLLTWAPVILLQHVWCVVCFGGSPGKLMLKLRLVAKGEETLTSRHALVRLAPALAYCIVVTSVETVVLWQSGMDAAAFANLSHAAQERLIGESSPAFLLVAAVAMQIFTLADLATAYDREDHRSLRDKLAGTIVIYSVPRVVSDTTTWTSGGSTSAMR